MFLNFTWEIEKTKQEKSENYSVPFIQEFTDRSLAWKILKCSISWALVTHAYNPSYSKGRDQEDCSLKSAQGSSLQDPISKIPNTKRASGVAQVVECLPSKYEALS
jgi:hypothetical protein